MYCESFHLNTAKTRTRWAMIMIAVVVVVHLRITTTNDLLTMIDLPADGTVAEAKNSPVIHWNSTEQHVRPPTIYTCGNKTGSGFGEIKSILRSALPEYTILDLHAELVRRGRARLLPPQFLWTNFTNPYDIFIEEFDGLKCEPRVINWLHTIYSGRFLLFSPESEKSHPVNHAQGRRSHYHAIGPLLDPRPTDVLLTYLQFVWWDKFQHILTPDMLTDSKKRPKGKQSKTFMIYANSNCVLFREVAVARLSELGVVHCAGACKAEKFVPDSTPMNRTNLIITKRQHNINIGNWWMNVDVYRDYQFCFVMEHEVDHPSYITEKILMAFSAGCVPIYYGPNLIFDIFNAKAFVFYNVSAPQPALDQIKEMRDNKDLYDAMLDETILANGEETLEKYFSFDNAIGNGKLKREIREKLGLTDDRFVP